MLKLTRRTSYLLLALFLLPVIPGAAQVTPTPAPSGMPADRNELGPSWDSRPAWQRLPDGSRRTIFERRAVETEQPSMVMPVVGNRPFRIPRAMLPVAIQKAPALQPLADPTPASS